jgi:predicted Holliday junction resolvase-like endonuclease
MVEHNIKQKENNGINGFLNIILKVILIIILSVIPVLIYRYTEPKVKLDDKTNNKIVELEKSNKRIEESQKTIEEKLVKYLSDIEGIDKNIKDINNKKEIIRKYYYEKVISVDTFNMATIDSFFTNRYRFNPN